MARSRSSTRGESFRANHHCSDVPKDINSSRGLLIEKKIEFLESFAAKISNRRFSKWLNDHLLMELVPPLNAEEIRGLFAPPPWGESTPLSPFCLTNVGEWDRFRNIDMDEEARAIAALDIPVVQRKDNFVSGKMDTLRAWHRVDHRSRVALRQNFHLKLVEAYEELIHAFVKESNNGVLELHVQDPFHRLLLHGVCEFYNVVGVTVTRSEDTDNPKAISKIMQIKKKSGCQDFPPIKLVQFLRMARGEFNGEASPLARSL
ncbi:uncharacterized protein LOC116261486 [Nymphaea colorata]|nr:uncharacterized protein LOC116261486 [Nymphaea colorata]